MRLPVGGWLAAGAALSGIALAAAPAGAELYRCLSADGRTRYTDDPSSCAHPLPHEPRGALQPALPARESAGRAAAPPAARELEREASEGHEAEWRGRVSQSRLELEQLEQRRAELERFVSHCNRGGEIFAREAASGLKHGVSCDAVRGEHAAAQTRIAELRVYLESGIHEECRRAGCLPGWLR
jgi:hypothetical protein